MRLRSMKFAALFAATLAVGVTSASHRGNTPVSIQDVAAVAHTHHVVDGADGFVACVKHDVVQDTTPNMLGGVYGCYKSRQDGASQLAQLTQRDLGSCCFVDPPAVDG